MRHVFVVGIRIGTIRSGYAFSSRQEIDQLKFNFNYWQGEKLLSSTVPTAVLLDEHKKCVAFGYDAMYSELLADGEHEQFYYFHQFMTSLHNQSLTLETKIKDVSGKSMDALEVLSIVIAYLTDYATKRIQQRLKHKLAEGDIYFVLTVPTILDDQAKQMMCKAAEKAGIQKQNFAIVKEAVAALQYCQRLSTERERTPIEFCQSVREGMQYMVIDLGGERVDITVYQKKKDSTIEEVLQPCSGPWGGKSIDEAFRTFLCDIFGQDVIKCLQEEEPEDYIDLISEFETKTKRSIRIDQLNKVVIILPVCLTDLVKKNHKTVGDAIENSKYKTGATYSKQKLHISPDVFRDLFKNTITKIVDLVNDVLKQPELVNTDTVCMIGGFAECELVQSAMRETINYPRKLIIPEEAGLAVLKGSVLAGFEGVQETIRADRGISSEQVAISKCVFCTEKGIFYCLDCKKPFCKRCKQNHDKLPATKNHYVKDAKSIDSTDTMIKCSSHKEEYSFSCLTCNVLICSVCVTSTHSRHKIGKVSELVEKKRKIAKSQVSKLKSQLKELNSQINLLSTSVLSEAKQESSCATKQIQNTVEQITKVLHDKERHKLNVTEDTNNLQLEEINYSLNEMKKTYENQHSVCQSIERILDEKHDVTFYTTYTTLKQEIADLSVIANYQRTTKVEPFNKERFLEDFIETLLTECNMRPHSLKDGKIVVKTK